MAFGCESVLAVLVSGGKMEGKWILIVSGKPLGGPALLSAFHPLVKHEICAIAQLWDPHLFQYA